MYAPKTRKTIFFDGLVGGIGWGIGAIIGTAILVLMLGFIASRAHAIPLIGNFVYDVVTEVEKLRSK